MRPFLGIRYLNKNQNMVIFSQWCKGGAFLKISKEYIESINNFLLNNTKDYYIDLSGSEIIIGDWIYCGIKDTGYKGGGVCERGHHLRYEHVIRNKNTDEYKVLGVNCVEHYFDNIDKEKVKKLKTIVRRYKNDKNDFETAIKDMVKYYGDFDNYLDKCFYIYALKNYKDIFSQSFLTKANSILVANLPLPRNITKFVFNTMDKKLNYSDFAEFNIINKSKEKIHKLINTKGLEEDEEKYVFDAFFNIYHKYAYCSWAMDYINSLYFSFYNYDI